MDIFSSRNILLALAVVIVGMKLHEVTRSEHSFVVTKFGSRKERTSALLKDRAPLSAGAFDPRIPSSITLKEYFVNKDDLLIHFRRWVPSSTPKALLVISHGFGEHIARYAHVADYFNKEGVIVYGLDHQGHGRSEGDRIFVKKFDDFVDDVIHLTKIAASENPTLSKNIFILGHSMGGAIALETLLKAQDLYKGAIISAPALLTDPQAVPLWQQNLAKLLGKIIPRFSLDPLNPDFISSEGAVVDWYVHDPLNHHGAIQAGIGSELLGAMERIQENAAKITLPYIILHSEGDNLVTIKGSEMFHAKSSSANKTFKRLKGVKHEIMNDNGDLTIIPTAVEWLKKNN